MFEGAHVCVLFLGTGIVTDLEAVQCIHRCIHIVLKRYQQARDEVELALSEQAPMDEDQLARLSSRHNFHEFIPVTARVTLIIER